MTTRKRALRQSMFAAVSTGSLIIAAEANAQSAASLGLAPEANTSIVSNHTITPGPGNPATGATSPTRRRSSTLRE